MHHPLTFREFCPLSLSPTVKKKHDEKKNMTVDEISPLEEELVQIGAV
jgi:hypothetical protein